MSDEMLKSQKLSEEITPVDTELSDEDLETVAGGAAIANATSSAVAVNGSFAASSASAKALEIDVASPFNF